MSDRVVCAIDVETSGLSPNRGDRVIECAAVMIEHGEIVSEFSTLINAPCKIRSSARRIHGITSSMLKDQPLPLEAWGRFLDFVGSAALVAHNIRFDANFIRHELARLGKSLPNSNICTMIMARRLYPFLLNHRLETVARHVLGAIPPDCQLHRASGDARLVARMWLAMEGSR